MVRDGQASAVRTIFVKAVFFLRGRLDGDMMGRKHARHKAGGRKHPDAVDGPDTGGFGKVPQILVLTVTNVAHKDIPAPRQRIGADGAIPSRNARESPGKRNRKVDLCDQIKGGAPMVVNLQTSVRGMGFGDNLFKFIFQVAAQHIRYAKMGTIAAPQVGTEGEFFFGFLKELPQSGLLGIGSRPLQQIAESLNISP